MLFSNWTSFSSLQEAIVHTLPACTKTMERDMDLYPKSELGLFLSMQALCSTITYYVFPVDET